MSKLLKNICSLSLALALVFTFSFSVIAVDESTPADPETEEETTSPPDTDTDASVESVKFEKDQYVLYKGDSEKVNVVVTPDDASDYVIEYSSDDETVVTIDSEGNITAKGKGTAKIIAECGDVSCEATVTVISFDLTVEEDNVTKEKFVSGFELGITVSEAKEVFASFKETDAENVKITSGSGEVSSGASLATGMVIEDGGEYYTVVIFGDVNGNGTVTYEDTKEVISVLSGGSFKGKAYEKAAYVNGNNTITVKNALDISDYVCGKLASL